MVMRIISQNYPEGELFGLEHRLNGLFKSVLATAAPERSSNFPKVDVVEYPGRTEVFAEVPGVLQKDIKVSIEKGALTLKGERKQPALATGSRPKRNEIWSGDFSRCVKISHAIRFDDIQAELTNGVLPVVLPKSEEACPRLIPVR